VLEILMEENKRSWRCSQEWILAEPSRLGIICKNVDVYNESPVKYKTINHRKRRFNLKINETKK
jgi:hypothetical protein